MKQADKQGAGQENSLQRGIAALFLILAFVVGLGTTLRAQEMDEPKSIPPAHEVAGRSMPAVFVVMAEDAQGYSLGFGTGFAIAKGIVVTNSHVIEGAVRIKLKRVNEEHYFSIDRILEDDPVLDLAVLQSLDLDSPSLALGRGQVLLVGHTIYTLGNPEGLEGTFSIGNISAIRYERGLRHIQLTAPISEGSSGGPVLNTSGEVVGVITSQVAYGQNLNFAIPVLYLHELLEERGIVINEEDMTAEVEERSTGAERAPSVPGDEEQQAVKDSPTIVADTWVKDFYWLWCPGYKNIPRKRRIWFTSRDEAESQGYVLALDCPDLREEL